MDAACAPRRRAPLAALLALTLALPFLLAGCAGPDEEVETTCTHTQWAQGKSTAVVRQNFPSGPEFTSTRKSDTLGQGLLEFGLPSGTYPLDRVEMDFHWGSHPNGTAAPQGIEVHDGRLTLSLFDDDGRPLDAYTTVGGPDEARHEWVYEPGVYTNFTLNVELAPRDALPDPRPVEARWDFRRDLDGDPETADTAWIWYTAKFWYRTCTP